MWVWLMLLYSLLLLLNPGNEQALTEWEYIPPVGPRPVKGFVGLKNAGATCYMNSVTQQVCDLAQFIAHYDIFLLYIQVCTVISRITWVGLSLGKPLWLLWCFLHAGLDALPEAMTLNAVVTWCCVLVWWHNIVNLSHSLCRMQWQ